MHLGHGWVTTFGAALDLTAVEFLAFAARGDAAVMSLHKLTAGDGYLYLVRQVAAADSTERGRSALSDDEQRFLVRVSAKYRNRPKARE